MSRLHVAEIVFRLGHKDAQLMASRLLECDELLTRALPDPNQRQLISQEVVEAARESLAIGPTG
jgi:hypothetical protein